MGKTAQLLPPRYDLAGQQTLCTISFNRWHSRGPSNPTQRASQEDSLKRQGGYLVVRYSGFVASAECTSDSDLHQNLVHSGHIETTFVDSCCGDSYTRVGMAARFGLAGL